MSIPVKTIDEKTLRKFLVLAGDRLRGDWVLIGGTVLPLLGIPWRPTVDIDVVGPSSSTQKEALELMTIAESLGLSVEAINQAGAFFLSKIRGWKGKLVPLHHGKTATLYRPNATLFLELKIGRLDESDVEDCLAMLAFAEKNGEEINRKHLLSLLNKEIKKNGQSGKKARLERLVRCLSTFQLKK